MIFLVYASLLVASFSSCICGQNHVFGYLPEWRFAFLDEDHVPRLSILCDSLTHLILFSIEVGKDGELAELNRFPDAERLQRFRNVCVGKNVKIMVCFGGNSRTNGFPSVSQNPVLRKRFMNNLREFYTKNALDGIDWNWEYPNSWEEWQGLINIIDETREALPHAVQTLAYYPDGRQERVLQELNFHLRIDWFHAMSYDQPGRHSTIAFAEQSIRSYKETGMPHEKMILGLPMYARNIRTGEWKTFNDLLKQEAHEDSNQLVDRDDFGEWFFNSPKTLRLKAKLAAREKIGGVMIWESGQDSDDMLLHRAIAEVDMDEKDEL